MIERRFLLFISSIILNFILIICLILTCSDRSKLIKSADAKKEALSAAEELNKNAEETYSDFDLIQDEENQKSASGGSAPSPGVSYTASRPSQSLSGIRGRVNTGEINPVNFDNPDINVLKQMGAEQYLIHYFTGEQFYKTGDYEKAITEYTAAVNIYPSFAEAFVSRGNIWLKKKDFNRAIDDYTRAIRLNANKAEVFNYRGFARLERGEHSQAIEDFSRAIALSPNYTDALINRSHAYYQTGNYDRAIEDCTRIISLEPDNAIIWNRRGSAYYRKEEDDKAISDFTEAIRLRRDYAVAYRNRGNAWQSKGEIEKALADFAAARQLQ